MSELDLVPGLLDEIQKEFKTLFQNDPTVKRIYKQIQNDAVDYDDANEFAIRIGEMLSQALQMYITVDTLPEGRFWFNMASRILEPTLGQNYELVSEVSTLAQKGINERAGIGLKAIKASINRDKINNFIDKVSDAEDFEKVQWMLGEPVVTYSQSVVDDTIKANGDFQAEAGIPPKIIRTVKAGCCEWCQAMAGVYEYHDMSVFDYDNVFRRHRRCRCTLDFIVGNKRQESWKTKTRWEDVTVEDRKRYAEAQVNALTPEERQAKIEGKK